MMFKKKRFQFISRNCSFNQISIFLYIVISIVTIKFIAPIFIPLIPNQPNVKDITVIIPKHSIESTVNSLKNSGFRNIHALYHDSIQPNIFFFNSIKKVSGHFGTDVSEFVNTDFVLYSGPTQFKVPSNIPPLPNKPMVIGYTFSQCHNSSFALLLPYQLEYSLITKEAMLRFNEFARRFSAQKSSQSEIFRIFADFHSLHLIMMPCDQKIKLLPKWETLEVIENETEFQLKSLDSIPKINEVWKIRDVL